MSRFESNNQDSINMALDRVEDPRWLKLFPPSVSDPDKSSSFMTRAIFVAFSVILNHRGLLAPQFFSSNHITEKLKCKTLNFQNPGSHRIAQLLRQAGEAVKKGYLEELALVVSNHEGDIEGIEVYSMKMHYFGENGVAAQFNTVEGASDLTPMQKIALLEYHGTKTVRDQLIMLVQSIMFLCKKILTPLPKEFSVNFRVSYTDETPREFKVPGFHETSTFYTFQEDTQSAILGNLRPGHHGSLFSCTSNFIEDSFAAETALKRYTEKVGDKLGYQVNETMYSTISSDGNATLDSDTSSTAVTNTTADNLAKDLANLDTSGPRRQRVQGSEVVEDRRARAAPYSKTRTRK